MGSAHNASRDASEATCHLGKKELVTCSPCHPDATLSQGGRQSSAKGIKSRDVLTDIGKRTLLPPSGEKRMMGKTGISCRSWKGEVASHHLSFLKCGCSGRGSFIKRSTTTMYFKRWGSLVPPSGKARFEGYVSLLSYMNTIAQW